jgi:hypothetical protein
MALPPDHGFPLVDRYPFFETILSAGLLLNKQPKGVFDEDPALSPRVEGRSSSAFVLRGRERERTAGSADRGVGLTAW